MAAYEPDWPSEEGQQEDESAVFEDVESFCALVEGILENFEPEQALRVAEEGARRYREEGSKEKEARALLLQARAYHSLYPENPSGASELAQTAAEALREAGNVRGELEALRLVGRSHREAWFTDEAVQAAKALLKRCKLLGDEPDVAAAHLALGEACLADDKLQEARQAAQDSAALCEQVGDSAGSAACQRLVCDICLAEGDAHGALAAALEAESVSRKLGDERGLALAGNRLALAHIGLGSHTSSLRSAEGALKLWQKLNDRVNEVDALIAAAQARMAILEERGTKGADVTLNVLHGAKACVAAALAYRKHDHTCVGDAHFVLARTLVLMSSFKSAELAARDAAKAHRKSRALPRQAEALLLAAEAAAARGDLPALRSARTAAGRAGELFERLGEEAVEPRTLARISEVYDTIDRALGRPTRSEIAAQQLALEQQMQAFAAGLPAPVPLAQVEQAPAEAARPREEDRLAALAGEGGSLAKGGVVHAEAVAERIRQIVNFLVGDEEPLELDTPLMEAGVTSNTAVVLRDTLQRDLDGIKLPPTLIFDYPSAGALSEWVAERAAARQLKR